MAATPAGANLDTYLDAYDLLGVGHSATPADIRAAYKAAARTNHPDRHPAGSEAQRRATETMAAINAAYELVRDAPLRYHRISTGERPDDPWSAAELYRAIERAKRQRIHSIVGAAAVVVAVVLGGWFGARLSGSHPSPLYVIAVITPPCLAMWYIVFVRGGSSLWLLCEVLRVFRVVRF